MGNTKGASTHPTVQSLLPSGRSEKDVPVVEFRFYRVKKDGTRQREWIPAVGFARTDGSFSCFFTVEAHALRLGVGRGDALRSVVEGADYMAARLAIPATFTVPKGLKPGEVAIVDLVVADDRVPATTAAAEEAIVIEGRMPGVPKGHLESGNPIAVVYTDGDRVRGEKLDANGQFKIKVRKLGGELGVVHAKGGNTLAYVPKVRENRVELPAYRQIGPDTPGTHRVTFRYDLGGAKEFSNLLLFTSATARIGVGFYPLNRDEGKIVATLPSGRYWVRLMGNSAVELSLDPVDVKANTEVELKIPATQPAP